MTTEKLYSRLPVCAQHLVCSGYGYLLNRRRYTFEYEDLEHSVFAREFWSESQLRDFACRRLTKIIQHAALTVAFYRRLFRKSGMDPRDIQSPADVASLPILTKAKVQEHLEEFHSETAAHSNCKVVHTSGSTGAGLIFPMTLEAEREQWAVWWRYRARFGLDRKTWYAHFYGKTVVPRAQTKPPFWRINHAGRQILFSAYHMSQSRLRFYVEELNRLQPPWIQGYPSLLAILANYILESGARLSYRPRAVTIGAETLLSHQKRLIEAAFGTQCRQHYGLTEGVANISECPEGNLHVDEDYGLVEFVPLSVGKYRIVATGYSNFAFPLLRYDTGDVAELPLSIAHCRCGRAGRIVQSIDGRIEDYVVLADGTKVGRLDHIFKDMIHVKEAQVVQNRPEEVIFRIVPGSRFTTRDANLLLREARVRLGNAINIQLEYTNELARTDRQKLRFVVSSLPQAKLESVAQ